MKKTNINDRVKQIIKEISRVAMDLDEKNIDKLIDAILASNRIVTAGAGRMGFGAKAFSMRLKHMGIDSYFLGDSNVPNLKSQDLLIVSSGSGETITIADIAKIAKKNKATLALLTVNPRSTIGKIADIVIKLKAPSKNSRLKNQTSQPMTTLTEQSTFILFDAIVLMIMDRTGETDKTMRDRHSNLE